MAIKVVAEAATLGRSRGLLIVVVHGPPKLLLKLAYSVCSHGPSPNRTLTAGAVAIMLTAGAGAEDR